MRVELEVERPVSGTLVLQGEKVVEASDLRLQLAAQRVLRREGWHFPPGTIKDYFWARKIVEMYGGKITSAPMPPLRSIPPMPRTPEETAQWIEEHKDDPVDEGEEEEGMTWIGGAKKKEGEDEKAVHGHS